MITHWGLLASTLLAPPQGPELSGTVRNLSDAPVGGVHVQVSPLPEGRSLSQKASYDRAQRVHWSNTLLPGTTSDPEGKWSLALTSDQAALLSATSGAELVASAPGYLPWRRTWTPGAPVTIVLEPLPSTPSLRLRLKGQPAYRGFLLVERPYRWRPDRQTWRGDLVPVHADGTASFHEPPRISGEAPAAAPTVRPEAYRITLLLEGLPHLRATIPPGEVLLDTGSSRLQRVEDSLQATYDHDGQEISLHLPGTTIPLLQGRPPLRLGNVPTPEPPSPRPSGDLHLLLVSQHSPVPGVGVWIEDSALETPSPQTVPFGVSDEHGMLTLRQLPFGRFHFLFQHPERGMREIPITHEPGEPALQVRLTLRKADTGTSQGQPGTMLLDLTSVAPEEHTTPFEVGILGGDRLLVRTRFPEWHSLLRVDGLERGATTLFVRIGEDPPVFLGGLLARGLQDEPVDLGRAHLERITLHVRDSSGAPELRASIGLQEASDASTSTDLFHLVPQDEPGRYRLELRLLGNIWARIHGSHGHLDVLLPGETRTEVLDTTLR